MNIKRKETRHVLTLATPVAVGSGTKDYNQLTNKPSINNVVLQGNLTLEDLGIQISSIYKYKGTVETVYDLTVLQDLTNGDVYHVESDGCDYCWNAYEEKWENLGNYIQIGILSNEDIDAIISSVEEGGS